MSKEPIHHQTLADLALQLGGVSTKTARRRMVQAMELDPGLRVIRSGRTLLFSDAAVQRILNALEWRTPFASDEPRTWRQGVSAAERKRSLSSKSVLETVLELTETRKKPVKP
ncbi:MAG: hypothetical protein JWO24_776 [Rhodospirillales bacterium]|nr:hypothetical protein [Rhodospirillales bacterium]